jgi:serine/threonine protein phosphatase PrpC
LIIRRAVFQEARLHPYRNVIPRAIGLSPEVEVDTLVQPLEVGDALLSCSDGLRGLIPDEEIEQVLSAKPPPDTAEALVSRDIAYGGSDKVAVVVARLGPES